MRTVLLSWFRRLYLCCMAVACGGAFASPVLTSDAITAGFSLSMFANEFPTTGFCCGPLGLPLSVVVRSWCRTTPVMCGSFRQIPMASLRARCRSHRATVLPTLVGLTRLGSYAYMTQQGAGKVVRLNLDGTYNSDVVSGIPSATGIFANPVNGKLYVSDCCSNSGIWEVDPVTNTKTQFKVGGNYDGVSISADGSTLYAELGGAIVGYRLSDGVLVFDSGVIGHWCGWH